MNELIVHEILKDFRFKKNIACERIYYMFENCHRSSKKFIDCNTINLVKTELKYKIAHKFSTIEDCLYGY